jgi:hypothetical protein
LETVQELVLPGKSRAERFLAWLQLGDRVTPIARGEATDSALVPRDEVVPRKWIGVAPSGARQPVLAREYLLC